MTWQWYFSIYIAQNYFFHLFEAFYVYTSKNVDIKFISVCFLFQLLMKPVDYGLSSSQLTDVAERNLKILATTLLYLVRRVSGSRGQAMMVIETQKYKQIFIVYAVIYNYFSVLPFLLRLMVFILTFSNFSAMSLLPVLPWDGSPDRYNEGIGISPGLAQVSGKLNTCSSYQDLNLHQR